MQTRIVVSIQILMIATLMAVGPMSAIGQETEQTSVARERIPNEKLPQAEHLEKSASGKLEWPRARTKRSFKQRIVMARRSVGQKQIKGPEIASNEVQRALRVVPRDLFAPPAPDATAAYALATLALPNGQVLPHPYVMAVMLQALALTDTDRALVTNEGVGYGAAMVNELTPYVFVLESDRAEYDATLLRLRRLGYPSIEVGLAKNVALGWKRYAPYDAILLMSAVAEPPAALWEQLAPGGRMVMPRVDEKGGQHLMLYTKAKDGGRVTETLMEDLEAKFGPLPKPENETDEGEPE